MKYVLAVLLASAVAAGVYAQGSNPFGQMNEQAYHPEEAIMAIERLGSKISDMVLPALHLSASPAPCSPACSGHAIVGAASIYIFLLESIVIGFVAFFICMVYYKPWSDPRGKMMSVKGKTVLITGGAGGLGKLFATRAVQEKASAVIIWDIDAKLLEVTCAELKAKGGNVSSQVVDVSKLDSIQQAAESLRKEHGMVHVLFNNAGIVRGKLFWENDPIKDIAMTININSLAPMWIAREFITDMMATAGATRIVNIGSAAGFNPTPGMAVYGGSKAACNNWSDSLRLELCRAGYSRVQVTTVCPAFINTGMFKGVSQPLLTPLLTPEKVVAKVWAGMLDGTHIIRTPWTVLLSVFLRGVLPIHMFDLVAGNLFGVYSSMDTFVGKKAE